MHRRPLLALLARYLERHPDEAEVVARIRALVDTRADCFERTCLPGHVTGSAWVVSEDRSRCLLTLHKKLGRWLQLGGHADGEPRIERVVLREVREESGMRTLDLRRPDGVLVPLDVDVHTIPAHGGEPPHEHHDVRFLVVAGSGQELVRSDESTDLRWFEMQGLERVVGEESVLRMARKADAL